MEDGRWKMEDGRWKAQSSAHVSAIKNALIVLAAAIEDRSLKKEKLYRKVDDRKHKLRNF